MTPDQLRAFVAIVETGRLVAASRRTGMAPASVTRRLQALEAELEATLVNRTSSHIEITRWGRAFYPHALEVLGSIDAAKEAVRSLKENIAGPLRVVSPSAFGRTFVAAHLPAFLAQHPGVDVSLLLDNRQPRLAEAQADIAFVIGEPPDGDERIRRLGSARLLLVGAPAYLDSLPAISHPADLADVRFVGVTRHTAVEHLRFGRADETVDVDVRLWISAFDPLVVSDLVQAGTGVALLSELFCQEDLRTGNLVEVLPDWRVDTRQSYAILFDPAVAALPRVRAFIDHFSAQLKPVFAALEL